MSDQERIALLTGVIARLDDLLIDLDQSDIGTAAAAYIDLGRHRLEQERTRLRQAGRFPGRR